MNMNSSVADLLGPWAAAAPAICFIIVFLIGMIALKIILSILKKILKKSRLDPALHTFITNIIKVSGIILILLIALESVGVKLTAIIAVLGAAGAAIALALKDSLANVAGGIIIMVTKPFGQGDYVKMGDTEGTVREINILHTDLKTADNKYVTIPNGMISTSVLTNFNRTEDRRVECQFCLDYGCDLDYARSVAEEVARECPHIVRDHAVFFGVIENAPEGLLVDINTWCEPPKYWDAKYWMEEHVMKAFAEKGIKAGGPGIKVTMNH